MSEPRQNEQSERYKNEGNQAMQAGNLDLAIEKYSLAINVDEENHILYSNRSAVYAKKEMWSEALADGTRCVFLKPDWPKGYLRKGQALQALGKYKDAQFCFQKGSSLDPKDQLMRQCLNHCNMLVYQQNQEEEAKKKKEAEEAERNPKPAAPPKPQPPPKPTTEELRKDLQEKPARELRAILANANIDSSDCVEKDDFINKILKHGAYSRETTPAPTAATTAPPTAQKAAGNPFRSAAPPQPQPQDYPRPPPPQPNPLPGGSYAQAPPGAYPPQPGAYGAPPPAAAYPPYGAPPPDTHAPYGAYPGGPTPGATPQSHYGAPPPGGNPHNPGAAPGVSPRPPPPASPREPSEPTVKGTFDDDIDYYKLLGIERTATPAEIKKAYYKAAQTCHPDKTDDPKAEEQFKLISEAYACLMDEEKRKIYDKYGRKKAQEMGGEPDMGMLIKMIFGGGAFDDTFGEMSFMQTLDPEFQKNWEGRPEAELHQFLAKQQAEQVAILSKKLIEKLALREKGMDKEFESIQSDILEKAEAPGGPALLAVIGYVYVSEAKKNMGRFLGIEGMFAGMEESGHNIKTTWGVLSSAVRVQRMAQEAESGVQHDEKKQAEAMLDVFWKIGKMEIEKTVRSVCDCIFKEKGCSKKKRGKALRELGELYTRVSKKAKQEKGLEKGTFFESLAKEMGEEGQDPNATSPRR